MIKAHTSPGGSGAREGVEWGGAGVKMGAEAKKGRLQV
jgi:hypothetical protein